MKGYIGSPVYRHGLNDATRLALLSSPSGSNLPPNGSANQSGHIYLALADFARYVWELSESIDPPYQTVEPGDDYTIA